MSLIEIPQPKARDLRYFGLIAGAMLLLFSAFAAWHGAAGLARILAAAAALLAVIYYALPPFRRAFYFLWMGLFFPLGWVFSHLLFAIIYFAVITPIGLALRLRGRDPLGLRAPPGRPGSNSYWHRRGPNSNPERYFRQY